jgi:hypothetical protein
MILQYDSGLEAPGHTYKTGNKLSLWTLEFLTLDQIILNSNYYLLLEVQGKKSNLSQMKKY